MKIRIQGNTIRFRLKQKEVGLFKAGQEVSAEIAFGILPQEKLAFVLQPAGTEAFTIRFASNIVTVQVPPEIHAAWTHTDLVGFEQILTTGNAQTITVLVEKDYSCLDGTDADNEDAYPNPNTHC